MELKTIKGFVTPNERDKNDRILSLCIDTDDGRYIVDEMEPTANLFDCIRAKVEVEGYVRRPPGFDPSISVRLYKLLL